MSRVLTSELSEMSIGPDSIETNGSAHRMGDSSPMGRINPWKGRAVTSNSVKGMVDGPSGASSQLRDVTGGSSSSEKLFEADAWPEPSAPFERRVTVSGSGTRSIDEKPKNKKLGRKWQNIEIEFVTSRGGSSGNRGGVRLPSGATNANHHSLSLIPPSSSEINSPTSSTLSRGGGGSNRRGGLTSNGSFNRGRGNRHINGYYQSRASLRAPDQDVVQEPSNDVSETSNMEPVSKAVPTAFVSGVPRGAYSSRGRRAGSRGGGYTNTSYVSKNSGTSASQPNTSTPLTVPQQVSVAAAAVAAQAMPQLPAVGPVTYLFPNMLVPGPAVFPIPPQTFPVTTEAAVMDGGAAALQAAVLLPQPSPQACLVSPEPTSSAVRNPLREDVTLEELLEFLSQYRWSRVRMPDHFRNHPTVAAAMQAVGMAAATGDETAAEFPREGAASPAMEKKEDIIVVDDRFYFVPLNSHLTKFLKFHSKQDYIRHHVEYYFSDINLQRDEHLVKLICMNKYTCPIGALLGFNRLRYVNTTEDELIEGVTNSSTVTVVYDDQQRAVGVTPQNPSVLRATAVAYPTSFDCTSQQSTQAPDLQQPKSSEVESSQVLMPVGSIGSLPFVLSNGIPAPPVPGLQPNGSHIFQSPHFLPYPGVPTLPSYYGANTLPGTVATGAAGDHTVTMNPAPAPDSTNVCYRPLWPTPSVFPQAPASFLPYITSQHQPFYVPLLQPPPAGLTSVAASVHNNISRNPPVPFLPVSVAVSSTQLSVPQQRTYAVSVRAPHRPPSNRTISGDCKVIDETLEQNS
ncbi:hypothetical protein ECG_02122 [Echinococcus granulosus]|uniref:RNA binding protein Lupus La n=1 Tax=Echinococcus granulosus TaxID=6210 RepID=U6JEV0_ECHGR|nr:hypothetical protein EGR_04239 [Echinococcus granulosus]EUB60993.1 hypothetical protein EGR_04239 [Echinococcus granulosus]KAH9285303.1 hypothetical protein ECG_02122 [Echinococcus granulosus]CDS21842.1 RNA binding protein Lupus La [Echinococcus granulosus]